MNIPHKQLNVDINRKNQYTVDFIGHVNDKDVRYIDVTFNAGGTPITLEEGCTATVTYVSEGVLIDQAAECTVSGSTVVIGVDSEKVENLRSGILEVQPKVVDPNGRVLTMQIPILVRISPDIAEHGQVDDDSLGSYAEVVREIAAARKGYESIGERMDNLVAGNSIWQTTTAPTAPAAPENPGYGFAISNLIGGDRDVQIGDVVLYSYYYYNITSIIGSIAYAETRVSIRGAKGDPGDDYVLTSQDKAEIAGMVDISGKEDIIYKKSAISGQSQTGDDDTFYPTVGAVRDYTDGKVSELEGYVDDELDDIKSVIVDKAIIENTEMLSPDVTFNIENDDVADYLSEDDYTFANDNAYSGGDYASTNIPDTIDSAVNERPNGGDITIPTGGANITLYDTVDKTKWNESISGDTYTVKNLIPNRVYTYIIKNSSGEIIKSGSCKASGQVRFIDAGKATTYYTTDPSTTFERPIFNIRDLGGWACDGGHLKYGLIYRGCRLNGNYTSGKTRYGIKISPAQIDFFKNFLGIRDEIDFRQLKNDPDTGNTETAGDDAVYETIDDITDTALGIGVEYTIIPIKPYYSGINISSNNSVQNKRYAAVIKRIARDIKEGKPCYIHCLEGADRTATVAMLILALCGVSRNNIERDYELTSFSKDYAGNRNRRARNDSAQSYRWMTLIQYLLGSSFTGATFRDKIIDYVLKIGVTIEEINTIRAGLIDGAPEKIKNPNSDVSVTYDLTNINTDNPISSIAMYQPFEATLTALNMKEIQSVTVLMGNTDITSTAYIQEKISIPRVTGNISITASASDVDIYSKPSGGIPKTDLTSSVQTSLEKADSALQDQDLSDYVTAAEAAVTRAEINSISLDKSSQSITLSTGSIINEQSLITGLSIPYGTKIYVKLGFSANDNPIISGKAVQIRANGKFIVSLNRSAVNNWTEVTLSGQLASGEIITRLGVYLANDALSTQTDFILSVRSSIIKSINDNADNISETNAVLQPLGETVNGHLLDYEILPTSNAPTFSGNTSQNDPLIVTLPYFYIRNKSATGTAYTTRTPSNSPFSVGHNEGLFYNLETKNLEVLSVANTPLDTKYILLLWKQITAVKGLWAYVYYDSVLKQDVEGRLSASSGAVKTANLDDGAVTKDKLSEDLSAQIQQTSSCKHYTKKIMSRQGQGYGYPDNSLEGITAALKDGYRNIRLSVASTSDNVIYCTHSYELSHNTSYQTPVITQNGQPYTQNVIINDVTSEFIDSILYKGYAIPTLDEALEVISLYDADVTLEVKDDFSATAIQNIIDAIKFYSINITLSGLPQQVEPFANVYGGLNLGLIFNYSVNDAATYKARFEGKYKTVRFDCFMTDTITTANIINNIHPDVKLKLGGSNITAAQAKEYMAYLDVTEYQGKVSDIY